MDLELDVDPRSTEEKVSDLSDIFVGVDRDVIEAVLDGCDGEDRNDADGVTMMSYGDHDEGPEAPITPFRPANPPGLFLHESRTRGDFCTPVNKATDKLLEMVSTAGKSKSQQARYEESDLAVIACSILTEESASPNMESQSWNSLQSAEAKFRKNYKSFDSNQAISDSVKAKDRLNGPSSFPAHSFLDIDDTTNYNFYTNSTDNKPQREEKLLFKPEASSQEFLAKNSFEDMVRNMDNSDFIGSKTLGRTSMEKEDNYFSPNGGKISHLLPAKFNLSETNSFPDNFKNISMRDDKHNKNTFMSPIDPSDPIASFLTSNNASDSSAGWNAFYKEMNLEPISHSPAHPDLDISRIVNQCRGNNTVAVKNDKSNFLVPKKSGGKDFNSLGNESDEFSSIFKDFHDFSRTAFLPLVSHGNARNPKMETSEERLKVSSSSRKAGSNHSQYSDESASSENGSQTARLTKSKNHDDASHLASELSSPIPKPVPPSERYKIVPDQHKTKAVTPPQPLKPLKMPKGKNMKKIRKQFQQPLNESTQNSVEIATKTFGNESKLHERRSKQNPPKGHRPTTNEADNRTYDPFGWGEIHDILAAKPQSQSKQNFQIPSASAISKDPIISAKENERFARLSFLEGGSGKTTGTSEDANVQNSKSQSKQPVVGREASEMPLTLNKTSISNWWKSPIPISEKVADPNLPPFKGSDIVGVESSAKPLSSRLPPSLAMKPTTLPPSSPLLDPTPQKAPAKGPPVIQKPRSIPTSQNKIVLVGLKTPRGMLRHYLQENQPVMVILRGLPGSGKSYLARQLMEEIVKAGEKGVVLSTDDYFVQAGRYNFDRNYLDLAHDWNKRRALKSVKNKEPYIIIDNTNATMWQLLPYAEMAIQHNYDLRVCEPDTPWKTKLQELTRKNEHGVPKENIKRMKERYETLTTEQVVEEACKSLNSKGRLPHVNEDENQRLFQGLSGKSEQPWLHDEKVKATDVEKALLTGCKEELVTNESVLSDLGLTEWTSPQEQRKTNQKVKRSPLSNHPNNPSPKSPSSHITVDFLNNSLKKAMVDIERNQKDTLPMGDKSHSQSIEGSLPRVDASGDISLGFENPSMASGIVLEGIKTLEGTEELSPQSDQSEKDNIKNENKVEELVLNRLKTELVVNQVIPIVQDGEGKYFDNDFQSVCDSSKIVSPRETSSGSSQNDDYCSPDLASSLTSGSFHSCNSDEENEGEKERRNKGTSIPVLDSTRQNSKEDVASSDDCDTDIKSDLDDDLATPATVVDALEFTSNTFEMVAATVEFDGESDKINQTNALIFDKEMSRDDVHAVMSKADTKKNVSLASKCDNIASFSDAECMVQRLPSFTGSLVQYDDSEDSGEEKPMLSQVLESKELTKENEEILSKATSQCTIDKTKGNAIIPEIIYSTEETSLFNYEDNAQAQEKRQSVQEPCNDRNNFEISLEPCNDGNSFETALEPCNDGNSFETALEPCNEGNSFETALEPCNNGNSFETSLQSWMLPRENDEKGSHSSSEVSENSPLRNVKKKRIKKGHNPGPFLEETLIAETKSKDWNLLIVEPVTNPSCQGIKEVIPLEVPVVETISQSVQCEPYYFTLVYRLNSTAFSQELVDLSMRDASVIQISDASKIVPSSDEEFLPKRESRNLTMSDQSTMTDDTLDAGEVDLYILHDCFPMYSRKYLEDVMSICGNNLEWVTNHLIDLPPVIDVNWEQENVPSQSEEVSENHPHKNDFPQASNDEDESNSVKSLASLCREAVENMAEVDPDDHELEVIRAGQKRLKLIVDFGKERLHSVSHDSTTPDPVMNDFSYNYFCGPVTPEECWEWNPNQEFLNRTNKPIFPLSPSSPSSPTDARSPHSHSPSVFVPSNHMDKSPVLAHQSPFRFKSLTQEINQRAKFSPHVLRKELWQQPPPLPVDLPEEIDFAQEMTEPVLPSSFIRCLENMYGPLDLDLDNQGLLLDDKSARDIFNILKMGRRRQSRHTKDEQLKKDEALARALQEEEDERLARDITAHGDCVNSSSQAHSDSLPFGVREHTPASGRGFRTVSDTLHTLRGLTSNPKHSKFVSRLPPNVPPSSVWANSQKSSASSLYSIMEEEKASDRRTRKQIEILHATGDSNALATKLKRQELTCRYPTVPSELLEEIFINNQYSLEETERSLLYQYEMRPVPQATNVNQAISQSRLRSSQVENAHKASFYRSDGFQRLPEGDEAICYDDLRKEAHMFRGLARECNQKAEQLQKQGMGGAGLFYRIKVKNYEAEVDGANDRASSILFQRGLERLKRENCLDLHYYHIKEAIKAVDTAINMKIEEYKQYPERRNSYLNVITGRGQNSKGGIPRLKPAVINHLQRKKLRYEEITAGMLRVHIFATVRS